MYTGTPRIHEGVGFFTKGVREERGIEDTMGVNDEGVFWGTTGVHEERGIRGTTGVREE